MKELVSVCAPGINSFVQFCNNPCLLVAPAKKSPCQRVTVFLLRNMCLRTLLYNSKRKKKKRKRRRKKEKIEEKKKHAGRV